MTEEHVSEEKAAEKFAWPSSLGWRLLIAIIFGCLMAVLPALIAWQKQGSSFYNNGYLKGISRGHFRQIYNAVVYRSSPPQTLAELNLPQEILQDGWGRPFQYEYRGTTCTITSYGRDGKPGGSGFDEDLSSDDPDRPTNYEELYRTEDQPTLYQFYFELPTRRVLQGAVITGLISFAMVFSVFSRSKVPDREKQIFLTFFFVTSAALVYGFVIAALHIPTGH